MRRTGTAVKKTPGADDRQAPLEPVVSSLPPLDSQRIRPALPGTPIGSPHMDGAAICCLVVAKSGNLGFLTTNRFLREQEGTGTNLLQPGIEDGGNPTTDVIGTVDEVVPVHFDQPNTVAGALAKTSRQQVAPEFPGIGLVQSFTSVALKDAVQILAEHGDKLEGNVIAVNAQVRVPFPGRGEALYQELIEVRMGDSAGARVDSGSPVLTKAGILVGMAFYTASGTVFVIPFDRIMHALSIQRLVTDEVG